MLLATKVTKPIEFGTNLRIRNTTQFVKLLLLVFSLVFKHLWVFSC